MPGTTVGKYRIVGPLGRGATGVVYRAVDDTLGREVALKILNPAHTDPEILKRFRAEATVLASLNHPGIATIYELLQSETELLMVMELVRGETIERWSNRLGPLAPDRAAYLIDGILSALEHAHRAGVVHRDMKPANVMLTESGRVKVMDFGVARVCGAEHITMNGYLIGTPAYMAPEQVLGQAVDGRADLYSVGVMFHRLLTGMLPFTAETAVGMLQQQISKAPTPLHVHRNDLPDWCEAIVQRALAKSPDDRFQNAGSFREALARATGLMTMKDLASEFSIGPDSPPPEPALSHERTLVLPRTEPGWRAGDSAAEGLVSGRAQHTTVPMRAVAPLEPVSTVSAITMALRKKPRVRAASMLLVFAALVALLAYVPFYQAKTAHIIAEALTVETIPELVFETRILVGAGRSQQERGARLVLSNRTLSVTANGEVRHPLHSVPYDRVISISYSRGPDPMWNSPEGPAPVIGSEAGTLRLLGSAVQRHWIAVRTNTKTRFVVLRFEDLLIGKVLAALEERTGRAPQVVRKRTRT
jgi:protein kinase-like protein